MLDRALNLFGNTSTKNNQHKKVNLKKKNNLWCSKISLNERYRFLSNLGTNGADLGS